jgi:hypothetical protein
MPGKYRFGGGPPSGSKTFSEAYEEALAASNPPALPAIGENGMWYVNIGG